LQLSFVRRHQQLTSTTAVCTERCRQVNHADGSPWTHLTILQELHWLPVQRCVDFELATLMFKSLHGCAPSYLSDPCKSAHEASRHLHSSGAITWSRTRLGDIVWCCRTAALEQAACFTAVIWQSLPIQKTVENVFVCQGLGCDA